MNIEPLKARIRKLTYKKVYHKWKRSSVLFIPINQVHMAVYFYVLPNNENGDRYELRKIIEELLTEDGLTRLMLYKRDDDADGEVLFTFWLPIKEAVSALSVINYEI